MDEAADTAGPDEHRHDDRHGPAFGAAAFEPGQWVRNPAQPDWGPGQIQSVVGPRVTVNFENVGKILVNVRVVGLERLE